MLKGLLGKALDASIYFSFDRSGFERHARDFRAEDLVVDLTGRIALVTGANSGIGRATAEALARLGAQVWMLCRNRERGEAALREIEGTTGAALNLAVVDVSSLASVRAFAEAFEAETIDVLINNAGILPRERQTSVDGFELTWATNVAGPYLLTKLLMPKLQRSDDPRVITVSSGGMLTQKLSLFDLAWEARRFDGVVAYAQTKRAEVVLSALAQERCAGNVAFHTMHPGWVDTPGVETSLPKFYEFTKHRLRSIAQGADTIVWLAAAKRLAGHPGDFWFDRASANPNPMPRTRADASVRNALWALCAKLS